MWAEQERCTEGRGSGGVGKVLEKRDERAWIDLSERISGFCTRKRAGWVEVTR